MRRKHRKVSKSPCIRCGKPIEWARATRYCSAECRQYRSKPRISDEQRFWKHVIKTDTCWLWTGRPKPPRDYGQFGADKRCYMAHRYAWKLAHGEIATGKVIDHMCGNKLCVNVAHLQLLDPAEHTRLEIKRGKSLPYGNKKLSGRFGRRVSSDLSSAPAQGI